MSEQEQPKPGGTYAEGFAAGCDMVLVLLSKCGHASLSDGLRNGIQVGLQDVLARVVAEQETVTA